MSALLEQLGIAEVPLVTQNYQIKILRETENEIVGEFKSDEFLDFEFSYVLNSDNLEINGENLRIDYLKDAIRLSTIGARERSKIAKDGKCLDVLINDKDPFVKVAVAEQGYALNILINDADHHVRMVVANQGYGLDTLINDKNSLVRERVAAQSYGLEKLINDKDPLVRAKVADQGYKTEILINDKNNYVREIASEHIKDKDIPWYGCKNIYCLPKGVAGDLVDHPEALYIEPYNLPKLDKLFKTFNKNGEYQLYVRISSCGLFQILIYNKRIDEYKLFKEEDADMIGECVCNIAFDNEGEEIKTGNTESIFIMFIEENNF